MSNGLSLEINGAVAWLRMRRPEVANAIDSALITEFDRLLNGLEGNLSIRCLVMTGEGATFSSGIDLRAIRQSLDKAHEDEAVVARGHLDHLVCRLLNFRIPIIAAVNGAAIGAGMTLALTADLIVMAEDAYLEPSFTRLGFVPDQGITYLLPHLIGAARSRAVLMLAERINAQDALSWGLAYRSFPAQTFVEGVNALASRLATGPSWVLGATRRLWYRGDSSQLKAHMKEERSAQESALRQGECLEGVEAFLQKRQPTFCDRPRK